MAKRAPTPKPRSRSAKRSPEPKASKAGRPTLYRDTYARQAYRLALLGATDTALAAIFEVSTATLSNWKLQHPEFLESLKRGKDEADANVAKSLYRRALGYSHKAVKIVADAKTGAEHTVDYIERYPPDTTAAIFWLKNRQPDAWRDRQQHEHTGRDGGPIETRDAPPQSWQVGDRVISWN